MSLIVDEHRQYLMDQVRVSAFRDAIGEIVKPGDVVLDLGSGTGILGLLACRAGAKRVYSIEEGGMIELARGIGEANGFQDRVVFLKGLSTRVELPEKVDVVVSDQIGRFGFEAGVSQYFRDARERFLKAGGTMIPARVQLWVAPVECAEKWEQVEFWNNSTTGFNLRPARALAANTGYPTALQPQQLLGTPVCGATVDFLTATSETWQMEVSVVASRAGSLHGIGGWFSAQLSPSVTMTNSPLAPQRINRQNVFLPIDQPVELVPGDCVRIRMHIIPSDLIVTWKVEVWREDPAGTATESNGLKARFTHSTLRGMLLCKEDLERTEPSFIPKLSPWGEARRSILELCDGGRPLAEIEREIYRRHSKLFRSPGEAAAFVAEVIIPYAL